MQRTGERNLSFRPAADRADLAIHRGTTAPGAPFSADFTQDRLGHAYEYYQISSMQRVDLYIKVEVLLEEEEKPEKVAREICRQLEKLYMVRSAELSNTVARD